MEVDQQGQTMFRSLQVGNGLGQMNWGEGFDRFQFNNEARLHQIRFTFSNRVTLVVEGESCLSDERNLPESQFNSQSFFVDLSR